ncbi:hypothetical protein NO1_1957 [Candidatus Termititenax aidoneus]|uniref:Uncharacterized protein n=1 Tax=Termititenax aidoneus TaxID=2218524 RepID=A0A388TD62_TERA1|nr:hypothetical protein NO1_1957 [Candidatus Termititenax aidoneus]
MENNKPIDSKTLGKINGAKWEKRMENGGTLYSYTFHRSYKDNEGNYQKSTSFYAGDLPVLQTLIDYFLQKSFEPSKNNSEDIVPF